MNKRQILAKKLEERAAALAELDAIIDAAESRAASTPEEVEADTAKATEIRSTIAAIDESIVSLDADIASEARAAEVRTRLGDVPAAEERQTGSAQVTDPEMYPKGGDRSYFRDLYNARLNQDHDAADRLRRNTRAVADAPGKHGRTNPNTTAGTGGEFAPPLWSIEDWIYYPRPGRPTANIFERQPLPSGVSSINLPQIASGSATALVSTQNSTLQNTALTTGSVTAAVQTIGGIQILSIQLLEQSPVNMDEVIFKDLQADLDKQVDLLTLTSSTTNAVGLLAQNASYTAGTFTSGSPTQQLFWSQLNKLFSAVYTARYANPTHWIMHPRRWQWMVDALDGQNRPLVVPTYAGPMNVLGLSTDVAYQGQAGQLLGLPVILDPNIPITCNGAGTFTGAAQDQVALVVAPDLFLYETTPQAEVFRETKADQGSVLVRLYEYAAVFTGRLPAGIGVIAGTGLTTPTF